MAALCQQRKLECQSLSKSRWFFLQGYLQYFLKNYNVLFKKSFCISSPDATYIFCNSLIWLLHVPNLNIPGSQSDFK